MAAPLRLLLLSGPRNRTCRGWFPPSTGSTRFCSNSCGMVFNCITCQDYLDGHAGFPVAPRRPRRRMEPENSVVHQNVKSKPSRSFLQNAIPPQREGSYQRMSTFRGHEFANLPVCNQQNVPAAVASHTSPVVPKCISNRPAYSLRVHLDILTQDRGRDLCFGARSFIISSRGRILRDAWWSSPASPASRASAAAHAACSSS